MRFTMVLKDEWEVFWSKSANTNLIQSWEFGEAKAIAEKLRPIRYVVTDSEDRPVALLQVLIRKVLGFCFIVKINRGPILLVDNYISALGELRLEILTSFLRYSSSQNWLLVQVAPEIYQNINNELDLSSLGWRVRGRSWGSALINLCLSEQDLLMSVKGRWRRNLRKAQKQKIIISRAPISEDLLNTVIELYSDAQDELDYRGVSANLIRSLAQQKGNTFEFVVHLATSEKSEILGAFISIIHGKSATYFISCSTPAGKKLLVNYSLIWAAIMYAKERQCDAFDLGGITGNTTPGILQFKTGLNGDFYSLVDWFVSFPISRRNKI